MVEIVAVNWIIIGLEIVLGLIWAAIFFVELFPFLKLTGVKYHFNDEFQLKISKTARSWIGQLAKFLGNLILIVLIIVISYLLSEQQIPIIHPYLVPVVDLVPTPISFIFIGLLVLLIPKRVLGIVFSPYWIRQLKYFVLLGLVYLPLFILDQAAIEAIPELGFLDTTLLTVVNLFLPTQLLKENGFDFTLIEKQQLFLLIFIIVPLGISLIYQFLPRIFGRFQKYGIYEWKEEAWHPLDDDVYDHIDDSAVLLLHGLGSSKSIWNSYSKERGTERIMDYVQRNTDEQYVRPKIFGIDFTDRLKDSFSTQYRYRGVTKHLKDTTTSLNNYVWELLFAIILLKDIKEIERIHIIAHSSSGVIVRKLLQEIYTNPDMDQIKALLDFNTDLNTIDVIDKVSWMAVPHLGAKGGSAILLGIQNNFFFKYLIRLLFAFPLVESGFNKIGRLLVIIGLDAQAAHDLDPRSGFMHQINPSGVVQLYGRHSYKNAYATGDQVVGSGGIIGDKYDKQQPEAKFEEKKFSADHANAPWEQFSQLPNNQIHDFPPIHHSLQAIHWIMSSHSD